MGQQYLNGVLYGTGEIIKFSPNIYSLEEQEVGVWTDGKPLYQKTCIFTGTFTGAMTIGNINVANIDKLPITEGTCLAQDGVVKPLSFAHSSTNNDFTYFIRPNGDVEFRAGNSVIGNDTIIVIYLTISYTKTTDTPGSGHYTTNGGEAHHYSTTEQIVGTWIDGNPLYEKTLKIENISTGTLRYSHGISNIDVVTKIDGFVYAFNGSRPLDYYMFDSNYNYSISLYAVTNSIIAFLIGVSLEIDYIIVTLQYTKTTD